jgi:serine/threonine protein kinase
MRCANCSAEMPEYTDRCERCDHRRAWLPPNRLLCNGKYRIEKVLGQGGYGITYLAEELILERDVAIKELYSDSSMNRDLSSGRVVLHTEAISDFARARENFLIEGRRLAKLRHPNVVHVYEIFEENGTSYLVMELVRGSSLRAVLNKASQENQRGLPQEQIVSIMDDLVAALEVVHHAGILHLDIKPPNIMIRSTGQAVLIDFGAARQLDSDTSSSHMTGSVYYSAPEIWTGKGFSIQSDLYSLGRTLYEMVCGQSCQYRQEGDLPEPWEGIVAEATHIEIQKRARSVQEWWQAGRAKLNSSRSTEIALSPPIPIEPMRSADAKPAAKNTAHRAVKFPKMAVSVVGIVGIVITGLIATTRNQEAKSEQATTAVSNPTPLPQNDRVIPPTPTVTSTATPVITETPKPAPTPDTVTPRLVRVLNRLDWDSWSERKAELFQSVRDGADPNARANNGTYAGLTALHFAAAKGDTAMIEQLIEAGADVQIKTRRDNSTPLHQAAANNAEAAVRLLLKRGAKRTSKNTNGKVPADLATNDTVRRMLRP